MAPATTSILAGALTSRPVDAAGQLWEGLAITVVGIGLWVYRRSHPTNVRGRGLGPRFLVVFGLFWVVFGLIQGGAR